MVECLSRNTPDYIAPWLAILATELTGLESGRLQSVGCAPRTRVPIPRFKTLTIWSSDLSKSGVTSARESLTEHFYWLSLACVSCGFRLRNARNASDCVWMETGLHFIWDTVYIGGPYLQCRGAPEIRLANNQRHPMSPSHVPIRSRCTRRPGSSSKYCPTSDGEQPRRQESIGRLDLTFRPSSSHLAQPCSGGCQCHSDVNSM